MKYADHVRRTPDHAFLLVFSVVGLALVWHRAITTEFTGDPVVDPAGWAIASVWAAAVSTAIVFLLASWVSLESRRADE